MKIKILTISVLRSMISIIAFTTSYGQSFTPKQTSQLSGTVVDMNESRVSDAAVTVEGEGLTRTVATSEDGTYKIKVHPSFWCKPDFLLFIMNEYQAAVCRS